MGNREDGDFTLGTYLVCLCGPGVQERAKGWAYRFGCHKNGTDQGECMESGSQICVLRGKSFVNLLTMNFLPEKNVSSFPRKMHRHITIYK